MTKHQSKIEKLISEQCPNGVEFIDLGRIWIKAPKSKLGVAQVKELGEGDIICFTSGKNIFYVDKYLVDGEYIFMNDGGTADTKYNKGKAYYTDHTFTFTLDKTKSIPKFIYYILKENEKYINDILFKGTGLKNLNKKALENFKIPVPPLAIQEEIVTILNNFTELEEELEEELESRKKQYEHYRSELFKFGEEVKRLSLDEVFDFKNGYTPSKSKSEYWTNGTIPWFRMEDIRKNGHILNDSLQYVNEVAVKGKKLFPPNSIIIATSATIGEHALITVPHLSNQRFVSLSIKPEFRDKLNIKFIHYYFYLLDVWCINNVTKSSFASVNMNGFRKFPIPLPDIKEQDRIISILDKFDTLVSDILIGLPAELKARRQQYEYYRSKLLTFNEYVR